VNTAGRLLLLGTGTVGRALVARHQRLYQQGWALPPLHWIGNSRGIDPCEGSPTRTLQHLDGAVTGGAGMSLADLPMLQRGDGLVDATASDEVAVAHPHLLARGVHVITANKLGRGAALARYRAIDEAQCHGDACYGDAATVGAGLPVLSSLRRLVAGGDRIHAIEAVLSGSLAWLFQQHDGSAPFSHWVRQARAAGYTEPDPRVDLSGEDLRRKLLILARAAGLAIEPEQVNVMSLVPEALAACALADLDDALPLLDTPLGSALQTAGSARLAMVARLQQGQASVALEALPMGHILAAGQGTDNGVVIHSDRYASRPLCIQGPGAGAEVTAAALLDDVREIFAVEGKRKVA
jgi:homoserine dehydrogenase